MEERYDEVLRELRSLREAFRDRTCFAKRSEDPNNETQESNDEAFVIPATGKEPNSDLRPRSARIAKKAAEKKLSNEAPAKASKHSTTLNYASDSQLASQPGEIESSRGRKLTRTSTTRKHRSRSPRRPSSGDSGTPTNPESSPCPQPRYREINKLSCLVFESPEKDQSLSPLG